MRRLEKLQIRSLMFAQITFLVLPIYLKPNRTLFLLNPNPNPLLNKTHYPRPNITAQVNPPFSWSNKPPRTPYPSKIPPSPLQTKPVFHLSGFTPTWPPPHPLTITTLLHLTLHHLMPKFCFTQPTAVKTAFPAKKVNWRAWIQLTKSRVRMWWDSFGKLPGTFKVTTNRRGSSRINLSMFLDHS